MDPTKVMTQTGVTRNGAVQFTLLPPQNVNARYYGEKLTEPEPTTERQRGQNPGGDTLPAGKAHCHKEKQG